MSWPEILDHAFVKDHVLIIDNSTPSMPLTRAMSTNTLQVKEQQRNHHIVQKTQNKLVIVIRCYPPSSFSSIF